MPVAKLLTTKRCWQNTIALIPKPDEPNPPTNIVFHEEPFQRCQFWASQSGVVEDSSEFLAHGSVHRNSMLIKIHLDATVCRYLFTAKLLYMFQVSTTPIIRGTKSVTAASGTGHIIGTATSLQRGQVPTWPRWRYTDIMTCTGGCGYSF